MPRPAPVTITARGTCCLPIAPHLAVGPAAEPPERTVATPSPVISCPHGAGAGWSAESLLCGQRSCPQGRPPDPTKHRTVRHSTVTDQMCCDQNRRSQEERMIDRTDTRHVLTAGTAARAHIAFDWLTSVAGELWWVE